MKRYLDADAAYKARLPRWEAISPGEPVPSWTPIIEELEEVRRLGEEVDEARAEWNKALSRYGEFLRR